MCSSRWHYVDWVFNGKLGALDRYDFHAPHVVGGEDHADGELSRYVEGELERVPQVPSHLALDETAHDFYVADTAGGSAHASRSRVAYRERKCRRSLRSRCIAAWLAPRSLLPSFWDCREPR